MWLGRWFFICVEPTQLLTTNRHVFALAPVTRALSERQAGHDVAHVLEATLRSGGFAGAASRREVDAAQQAQPVRVSKPT
jgi:hypothetical protein